MMSVSRLGAVRPLVRARNTGSGLRVSLGRSRILQDASSYPAVRSVFSSAGRNDAGFRTEIGTERIPKESMPPPPRLKETPLSSATQEAADKSTNTQHSNKTTQGDDVCPRNAVGVQLLSRSLQSQLFPATSAKIPAIHQDALSLSQHHLKSHGLEPEQAATLPPIAFDLPPLQGKDLSQHFWNLGRQAAQPWLGMANNFAKAALYSALPEGIANARESPTSEAHSDGQNLSDDDGTFAANDWLALDSTIRSECTLRPPKWLKVAGWVRYPVLQSQDGAQALGPGEPVEYPLEQDGSLVFDVETMVQESHFPVMATAASEHAWYAWLSPWFLQQGERHHEKDHLIPFGPRNGDKPSSARLLIGHNVSYDRARIREEYSLDRSNIRFIDTMSLHVATRGISSPQRGAWVKHNKSKELEKMLEQDDIEDIKKTVIRSILGGEEIAEDVLAGLDLDEVVAQAQGRTIAANIPGDIDGSSGGAASASLLWQDITSNNSLADVAKLHCNIDLPKDVRNFFVDGTSREEMVEMTDELLTYCATDVLVTHKIFTKVWPSFIKNCPNPATTAGMLALSSAILPVDDEWKEYLARCNEQYESSSQQVRENLVELAEQLRQQGTNGISWATALSASEANSDTAASDSSDNLIELQDLRDRELQREKLWWEQDSWACQLDWTPRKPKKNRAGRATGDTAGDDDTPMIPKWYRDKVLKANAGLGPTMALNAAILRLRYDSEPFLKTDDGLWSVCGKKQEILASVKGSPLKQTYLKKGQGLEVTSALGPAGEEVLQAIRSSAGSDIIREKLRDAADALCAWAKDHPEEIMQDTQLQMLDWTLVEEPVEEEEADGDPLVWWPKWYWDLYKSATGELEVTIRSKVAPILLRLTWQRCPLHHSREYGWVFRYDPKSQHPLLTRQKPLSFDHPADSFFRQDIERTVSKRLAEIAENATGKNDLILDPASITPVYYKVPHAAGDGSNVGSPFSKNFVPFFEKGTLQSEHPDESGRQAAKNALEINARCSYWIGVRDRVQKQMVVWDGEGGSLMDFEKGASGARLDNETDKQRQKGIILPQIVPMGTVTRRAIEKTWLTASNAKTNRVGSELKAMVKAPPGWSIVGADVDSQELWICSVMGDAQFGFHGATAVGWMTLEGSKSMGTDLHSKTAKILGTGRNQAKVFNYSRIYGAGIRHSSQLLLKATPDMSTDEAMQKAKELYASTKGKNTYTNDYFGRRFWFGGTESYVFNKLEDIALGEQPKTPALDCGVTAALKRKYLPKQSQQRQRFGGRAMTGSEDFMPSRVNWVVQSSGVDYLHLLITAMEHLISTYDLRARFMISVHDEVRYLAKDEDVQRVTMALQIANLWTRAMFAYKLQMESLPQGVGFFAQVDVDKVLRKETDDPCVTPSHPEPVPFGHALDVYKSLEQTNGGSLLPGGRPMRGQQSKMKSGAQLALSLVPPGESVDVSLPKYKASSQKHRSLGDRGLRYLQAQASGDVNEIASLEERVQRRERQTGPTSSMPKTDDVDFDESFMHEIEDVHHSNRHGTGNVRQGGPLMFKSQMHTSARQQANKLPSSIRPIVAQFPPRPFKLHVPFFKTKEHRFKILWQVYAGLLRGCPKELRHIREMIRERTRAKRHCTSPRQNAQLEEEARSLLIKFDKARTEDDEQAKEELRLMDETFAERAHRRKWTGRWKAFIEETKFKPTPRISGALLAPSVYNPPLLRYKPVQPDHITMMIAHRRRARAGRGERMEDAAERMRHLMLEAKVGQEIGSTELNAADVSEWRDTIREHERRSMEEAYERDIKRAQMVFTTSMLRVAKHARQSRKRHHIRRKLLQSKKREERRQKSERSNTVQQEDRDVPSE